MMSRFSCFTLGAALFLTACSRVPDGYERVRLQGEGKKVAVLVQIADTPEERAMGLMNRTELAANRGMLFVFPDAAPRYFWMKNTLIPLDIIYFDEQGKAVSLRQMEPCAADPCVNYPSGSAAKYALEVPSGFTQEHGVQDGWSITINPDWQSTAL